MRFLETMLLLIVAIYLAQLVVASLLVATLMLFLWVLYKRPREALVLGLAVVLVSQPIGLALVLATAVGVLGWALVIRFRRRRPIPRLSHGADR